MNAQTEAAKAEMNATRARLEAAEKEAASPALLALLTQTLQAQTRTFEALARADQSEREAQAAREAHEARRRSTMNTKHAAFTKALADLDAFVADASDGHFPAEYVARRKNELMTAARIADEEAIREHNANRAAKLTEARDLRAEAEAKRDPNQRIADEMERVRLRTDGADPNDLIAKAEAMLAAKQPERARFLLDTARALGGRPARRVDRAIEDALDLAIPQRAKARELETDVQAEADAFMINRYDALVRSHIGITESGEFGAGKPEQVASASTLAKAFKSRLQQAAAATVGGEA